MQHRRNDPGTLRVIVLQVYQLLCREIAFVNQKIRIARLGKKPFVGDSISGVNKLKAVPLQAVADGTVDGVYSRPLGPHTLVARSGLRPSHQ